MLAVDLDLIRKYDRPVPRYTSYPTAAGFRDCPEPEALLAHVDRANTTAELPLSLYFHLPFCASLCWFCGCTTVISPPAGAATRYLDYLERELKLMAPRIHPGRRVVQVHLGGGTPTFLTAVELRRLSGMMRDHFQVAPDAELSVEIDPRRVVPGQVDALRAAGFTRASLGVQDFDPRVQLAIHRVQPRAQTERVIAWLRDAGFNSINVDLIYGLPMQTTETFARTLEQVQELAADRLAIFSYAHVPWMKPAQKILERKTLPPPDAKLGMFKRAVETLTAGGYRYIGLDHFARPDDELARAQAAGTLQRNFQGYSTRAGAEVLGFGMSSIAQTPASYRQNHKELDRYYAALDAGVLPVARGLELTDEDRRRREIIMRLMCRLRLDFAELSRDLGCDFATTYAVGLARLRPLAADGLVRLAADGVDVTDAGRLFLRNLAVCFDAYHAEDSARHARAV